MADPTPALTEAEREAVAELLSQHVLSDDEAVVYDLFARIKADAVAAALASVECRWCPPGCPSCEPEDCECYRHQDWPDKTTDPEWPYLRAALAEGKGGERRG